MISFGALARALLIGGAVLFGLSAAHAQSPNGAPLFAILNGGNECNNAAPPNGPDCRKGDLDGIGSAMVLIPTPTGRPTPVCFAILVDNLAGATLAHIHRGVAGVNGPVVIELTPPSSPGQGNPGASSGCAPNVDPAIISAIRADPTRFYVNVHDSAFPGGAVRGQLH